MSRQWCRLKPSRAADERRMLFEVRIIAPLSYWALTSWKKRLPPPGVAGR